MSELENKTKSHKIIKGIKYFCGRFKKLNAPDSKPKKTADAKISNDDWKLR